MIFSENLSFARVADGGIEGCVVVPELADPPMCLEAVYSADLPRSKPCGLHMVEIGSGARQRLGSGGGDERISGDFKEDEQEF
jgi:hypothetical protein